MSASRRAFLASLGAAPLVYGLDVWGNGSAPVQDPSPRSGPASRPATTPTDPFAQALARMAVCGAPGLGIVLPDDAASRETLLERLELWCAGESIRASALLLRSVLVVAPRTGLPAHGDDAVVVFDVTGARAGGTATALAQPGRTSREDLLLLHELVDGFERRARPGGADTRPEPGQRELEAFLADREDPAKVAQRLEAVVPFCVPGGYPIRRWRAENSPLERTWLAMPIREAFRRRRNQAERLPFGVVATGKVRDAGGGCGSSDDDQDPDSRMPMVACGMAMLRVRALRFVEQVAKGR